MMYPVETTGGASRRVSDGRNEQLTRGVSEFQDDIAVSSKNRQKYVTLCPDIIDGHSVSRFNDLLSSSFPTSYGTPILRTIEKVKTKTNFKVRARFPWMKETGIFASELENSLNGVNQIVRSSKSFCSEPWFDFIEFQDSEETRMGQVRLIFENTCAPHAVGHNTTTVLARELQPVTISSTPESPGWNWKTAKLLQEYNCRTMKWRLTRDNGYVHRIVSRQDIFRVVSIVPDSNFPIPMESGSKVWVEATKIAVEKDRNRYAKAEAKRARRLQAIRERQNQGSSVRAEFQRGLSTPTPPARKIRDGPDCTAELGDHRLLHNAFMPWSSPAT